MAEIPILKPDYVLGGDLTQAITKISDSLIMLVGAITLLFLIIGGFQLISSGGNPESIRKGKSTILFSIIGLVLVICAYLIVTFVINNVAK